MSLTEKILPRGSRRRKLAGRSRRRLLPLLRTLERRLQTSADAESARLRRSWAKHSPGALDRYLITGYQNPRINAQSILTRHVLVSKLFGSDFDKLMDEEYAFCVDANATLRRRAAELGVSMGVHIDEDKRSAVESVSESIADREATFEKRWAAQLAERSTPSGPNRRSELSVLELACGSANDYRFFDSYGIAQFLDYSGVDLNPTNVDNARRRYPHVRFEVANIVDLPYADDSVDYVIAFDIFEHLSVPLMEQAIGEAMRVAARGLVLTFFVMVDRDDHHERPWENYHWNELSAPRIRERLETRFSSVRLVHIPTMLQREYGATTYYNKRAWTAIAEGKLD